MEQLAFGAGVGGEALSTQNIINQRLGQKTELWLQVQLPLPFPGPQPERGGESFTKLTLYEKVSGPSLFLPLIPDLALAPEGQGQHAGQQCLPLHCSSPKQPLSLMSRCWLQEKKNAKEVAQDTSSCSHEFHFTPVPHGSEDCLIPSWDCPKHHFFAKHRYNSWSNL